MAKRTPPTRPGHARRIAGLGLRLRTARLARGMSQANLAERVGVDRTTIGKLEAGDAGTSLSTVLRVLAALGLEQDIDRIAADDMVGRQLAANRLRRPAPRRKPGGYAVAEAQPGSSLHDGADRDRAGRSGVHEPQATDAGAAADRQGDARVDRPGLAEAGHDRYRLVSSQRPPRIDPTPGVVRRPPRLPKGR